MVASSFSTVETICPLMVSARAWLFASAVRHHRMWTPIALTMIDARTRPEIVRRMPIRIIGVASCCMYRKKRQRCKANVFASATFAVAKIGQQQGAVDGVRQVQHVIWGQRKRKIFLETGLGRRANRQTGPFRQNHNSLRVSPCALASSC